jgi:hypothetical protein
MTHFQDLQLRRQIGEDRLLHLDRCITGQQGLELSIADQKHYGLRVGVRPW